MFLNYVYKLPYYKTGRKCGRVGPVTKDENIFSLCLTDGQAIVVENRDKRFWKSTQSGGWEVNLGETKRKN
jgi:hypothetical protein